MSKLHSITSDQYKIDAHEILRETIEKDPDTVIVLAFWKSTKEFIIKSSAVKDRLTLVGALEEAKHHLLMKGAADKMESRN